MIAKKIDHSYDRRAYGNRNPNVLLLSTGSVGESSVSATPFRPSLHLPEEAVGVVDDGERPRTAVRAQMRGVN